MRVLVTGRGESGSWSIRGEQLGRAIGATVMPNALDVGGYDLAVLVKRPVADLVRRLQTMQVPIVYDVVDAWPQPHGNLWNRAECMTWLAEAVRLVRPAAIVAATKAMAEDCAEFGVPVLALPHHAWPNQGKCVIRSPLRTVGYQGGTNYLGRWKPFMEAECARRGWKFIVNPPSVASVDIVIAVRQFDGYAARKWKSNVKLANAQGCGTPVIVNREAGYEETACGAERWADTEGEMVQALDQLTPRATRVRTSARLAAAAPKLPDIAKTYSTWLQSLKS